MSIEDIIEFLGKIEEEASASQIAAGRARAGMSDSAYVRAGSGLNLKQRYLQQITEDKRTDSKYFTQLGMLKIQKCVATHNNDMAENESARMDLYQFLESKD